MSGFTNSGRLAIPICVTRPKGSLALRLTSSPSQAPASGSPRPPLSRLHGERASAMVSTFQLTRSTELCLTHPRSQREKYGEEKRKGGESDQRPPVDKKTQRFWD